MGSEQDVPEEGKYNSAVSSAYVPKSLKPPVIRTASGKKIYLDHQKQCSVIKKFTRFIIFFFRLSRHGTEDREDMDYAEESYQIELEHHEDESKNEKTCR